MANPTVNPYEAVPISKEQSGESGRYFKRFVVALFSFFLAFWAGAITLFAFVVLHEKGLF